MKKHFILLAALTLSLVACNESNPYDAYAQDFCNCVQPFTELRDRIDSLGENPSDDEMSQLYAYGQQVDADVQTCMMRLQEKYKDLDMEKEEEIMNAIRKACPHIVEMMEQSAQPEPEMPESDMQQMPDSDMQQEDQ